MVLPTIAERNIEELNSFGKFDYFINLSSFYYLKRCRNGEDYSNYKFVIDIRYVYVENLMTGAGIINLQNFCRQYYRNYFSV